MFWKDVWGVERVVAEGVWRVFHECKYGNLAEAGIGEKSICFVGEGVDFKLGELDLDREDILRYWESPGKKDRPRRTAPSLGSKS